MSVPYPVVHCPDPKVRANLVADLKALGFRRHPCTVTVPTSPYIALQRSSDHEINGVEDEDAPTDPEMLRRRNETVVNSPSHMLAYIARHGIKPHTPS